MNREGKGLREGDYCVVGDALWLRTVHESGTATTLVGMRLAAG